MLLLIDCHCILHRVKHHVLEKQKSPNNEIISQMTQEFLWEVLTLVEKFGEPDMEVCFIWDSNKNVNKRKKVFPDYKEKAHKEISEADLKRTLIARKAFPHIRMKVLRQIGFKNSFIQTGLEADDLIAKIVDDYCKDHDIIFVANDHDMYQVLRLRVVMYNPYKRTTTDYKAFMDTYNIAPNLWGQVKALGGCSSDNVKGIKSIGEKRAIDYLTGKLSKKSQAYKIITSSYGQDIFEKTLPVVQLPHAETKSVEIIQDRLDCRDFKKTCEVHGIDTFLNSKNSQRWQTSLGFAYV